MPQNDLADIISSGTPERDAYVAAWRRQIMWSQVDADQPTRFQYNRSGCLIANRKYPFVQSDIFDFNIVF